MLVTLRAATLDDLPLMMAWRSNPIVYKGFYSQTEPLRWDEHMQWFLSRPSTWRTFIVLYAGRPVGVVNLGQTEHWSCEIGYYLGEVSLWGSGIGKEAVRLGLKYAKEIMGKEYCHTTIKDDNERSIKLVKSLGFECLGKAREGKSWYQKKL